MVVKFCVYCAFVFLSFAFAQQVPERFFRPEYLSSHLVDLHVEHIFKDS